jgi:cobalt-zinc-cadmium efflux system membrane fusion protein
MHAPVDRASLDDDGAATGRWRRAPIVLGAAVLFAVLAALGWWLRPATPPAAPATQASLLASDDVVTLTEDAQRDAGLVVAEATTVRRADSLTANAVLTLDERRTARVGSVVEGLVVGTFSEVGDRVRAQQVLAHLHSHVVHDAWAEYRKAVAERRRAQTELDYATEGVARAGRLLADKAISAQEQERAVTNRALAAEQLDIASTEVRRAEEALEHLGITNAEDPTGESGEQIPARAPFAGVVLERLVTTGTAVTPGTTMFVVSDLSSLWAMAEVDESALGRVGLNRPVHLRVPAYPDETFEGRVTLIGDTVNPKTRRVVVRCDVPNPTARLKPEMYATVTLDTGPPRPEVAVPAAAVQELEGHTVVFVAEGGGRFRQRRVTAGSSRDGLVEIRDGLRAGERVATTGSFLLKSAIVNRNAPPEAD